MQDHSASVLIDTSPLLRLERIALKPRSKEPLHRGWRRLPALTDEQVEAHLAKAGNVGAMLRDDQLVIDADPRNYVDGVDSLDKLRRDFRLPPSPTVETGGGGTHIYMRIQAGMRLYRSLADYPGVDFKSAGGQVVIPPSVHPNGKAYVWDPLAPETEPLPDAPDALIRQLQRTQKASVTSDTALSAEWLRDALEALDVLAYSDHDRWLTMAMSCHEATDGEGLDEFVSWCAGDPAHVDKLHTIPGRWASFDGQGGVTRNTLFQALNKAGHGEVVDAANRSPAAGDFPPYDGEIVEDTAVTVVAPKFGGKKPVTRSYRNIEAAVQAGNFGVALNLLTGKYEFRGTNLPFATDVGRELSDRAVRLIRIWIMRQFNFEAPKEELYEVILGEGDQNSFDPMLEYYDGLAWDGVERVDSLLPHYFSAADDPYSRAVGRALLLAMVRRARKPGAKFDTMLILEGKQGSGKSSALRILGGKWFSDATLGKLDNRDAYSLLQGKSLIEMGELNALRKTEANQMKEFISKDSDEYRAAYGKVDIVRPRRCVFVGTTNSNDYLQDPTGNRRFWPVATGRIDLAGLRRDRDQLFAEACVIEATGEELTLPYEIWHVAEEQQGERMVSDPWLDLIGPYLVDKDRVSARELFESVLAQAYSHKTQVETKRLRGVMSQLGWAYKKSMRFGLEVGGGYVKGDDAN